MAAATVSGVSSLSLSLAVSIGFTSGEYVGMEDGGEVSVALAVGGAQLARPIHLQVYSEVGSKLLLLW